MKIAKVIALSGLLAMTAILIYDSTEKRSHLALSRAGMV